VGVEQSRGIVEGIVRSSVYRKSIEPGFDARLLAYMQMLVRNLDSADHRLEVLPPGPTRGFAGHAGSAHFVVQ
jgi:hypothetical protein